MKTQTLLLGEYDSSVFSIYIIPESGSANSPTNTTDYLSIEDLYRLFFHHSQNEITPLFFTLFQRHPHDFYHDHQNKCYIAKHHALTIARSLHLFALAEFCTLRHDELINRAADPLFAITNAVMLRPATPKLTVIDWDWFCLSPDASSTSFFSNFLNAAARFLNHGRHQSYFPITCSKQNDHSWSRHFLPLPNIGTERTIQAQKQQQAIIECRQRLSVYYQSISSASHKLQSKKSAAVTKTKTSSPVNHNTALSTILSPSSHLANESNKPQQQQKKRKSSSLPLLNEDSYYHRQKKLKSSHSNLDLLATQATKMKDLPLSPEISPPPQPILSLPPISISNTTSFHTSSFIQSISLPSIRNVLSDI
ncbi:unnamed protein product [Absidia cylindrospora]